MEKPIVEWDGAAVRSWLAGRIVAARADQVAAERSGRDRRDDCDKAAAEEMVCAGFRNSAATDSQAAFVAALKTLADREAYVWRGVYDDSRFDRHVRSCVRRIITMARTKTGFANRTRYQ